FAVAFAGFLFVSGFHNVLLLEPMSVMGPSRYAGNLPAYFRAQIVVHMLLVGALSAALLLAGAVLWRVVPGNPLAGAVVGGGLALPFLLLAWLARRMCYVVQRPALAMEGSAVYVGLVLVGRSYRVLGVRVDAVQIAEAVGRMEEWIARREGCRYVAVTGMHGVTEAQHDAEFKTILNAAGLVVADGMPLVWLGRRHGFEMRRRVYGPELMSTFLKQTARRGYRHYFYGGAPGVAEELAGRMAARYPGLEVAGTYSPPYRALTEEEDGAVVEAIERAKADVVWVGLSTPKQERWMYEHRERLGAPVCVGVGAAFDFHTGRVAQAPEWMREHGLEWLYRLWKEPRRLWRRYLVYGAEFTARVVLEEAGMRKMR
ncbi:MAG TPA: WecB/TagA/CpsF family glycosyltransferase, partial [Candidatus Acidoferrum sp.]